MAAEGKKGGKKGNQGGWKTHRHQEYHGKHHRQNWSPAQPRPAWNNQMRGSTSCPHGSTYEECQICYYDWNAENPTLLQSTQPRTPASSMAMNFSKSSGPAPVSLATPAGSPRGGPQGMDMDDKKRKDNNDVAGKAAKAKSIVASPPKAPTKSGMQQPPVMAANVPGPKPKPVALSETKKRFAELIPADADEILSDDDPASLLSRVKIIVDRGYAQATPAKVTMNHLLKHIKPDHEESSPPKDIEFDTLPYVKRLHALMELPGKDSSLSQLTVNQLMARATAFTANKEKRSDTQALVKDLIQGMKAAGLSIPPPEEVIHLESSGASGTANASASSTSSSSTSASSTSAGLPQSSTATAIPSTVNSTGSATSSGSTNSGPADPAAAPAAAGAGGGGGAPPAGGLDALSQPGPQYTPIRIRGGRDVIAEGADGALIEWLSGVLTAKKAIGRVGTSLNESIVELLPKAAAKDLLSGESDLTDYGDVNKQRFIWIDPEFGQIDNFFKDQFPKLVQQGLDVGICLLVQRPDFTQHVQSAMHLFEFFCSEGTGIRAPYKEYLSCRLFLLDASLHTYANDRGLNPVPRQYACFCFSTITRAPWVGTHKNLQTLCRIRRFSGKGPAIAQIRRYVDVSRESPVAAQLRRLPRVGWSKNEGRSYGSKKNGARVCFEIVYVDDATHTSRIATILGGGVHLTMIAGSLASKSLMRIDCHVVGLESLVSRVTKLGQVMPISGRAGLLLLDPDVPVDLLQVLVVAQNSEAIANPLLRIHDIFYADGSSMRVKSLRVPVQFHSAVRLDATVNDCIFLQNIPVGWTLEVVQDMVDEVFQDLSLETTTVVSNSRGFQLNIDDVQKETLFSNLGHSFLYECASGSATIRLIDPNRVEETKSEVPFTSALQAQLTSLLR